MNTRSTELKPGLTMQLIREAHARIRDKIHRTPVMTSEVLDGLAGNRLFF
jgi:threonine dehydratase